MADGDEERAVCDLQTTICRNQQFLGAGPLLQLQQLPLHCVGAPAVRWEGRRLQLTAALPNGALRRLPRMA